MAYFEGDAGASIQTSPVRWEYRDLTISLNNIRVDVKRDAEWKRAISRMNDMIVENLQHEGQSGWQAEGSTDFQFLFERNVVDYEWHQNWLNGNTT